VPWQRNLGLGSQLQKQLGKSQLLLSAVTGKVGTRNDMSGYPALGMRTLTRKVPESQTFSISCRGTAGMGADGLGATK